MISTIMQDQSLQDQRDNQIREKIAEMLIATTIADQVSATVDSKDTQSSVTNRVYEEEVNLEVLEDILNIVDRDVSAKGAPSSVMDQVDEQEVTMRILSNELAKQQNECSSVRIMTFTSNNSNAIMQSNIEEDWYTELLDFFGQGSMDKAS